MWLITTTCLGLCRVCAGFSDDSTILGRTIYAWPRNSACRNRNVSSRSIRNRGIADADFQGPSHCVAKVREVRMLREGAAILRAVAGMVPPGKMDLMPERNAIQTVVASRQPTGEWKVEVFHNTPARFDGRPELSEKLTAELREQLSGQDGGFQRAARG